MCVNVFILCYICALPAVQAYIRLRILHAGDFEGRIDQVSQSGGKCFDSDAENNRCYGGFPRMITAVTAETRKAEKDGVPIIFLHTGGSFTGSLWYNYYKWPIVSAFTKFLSLDAMCLGVNEFVEGPANLTDYLKDVKVPAVVCNADTSKEPAMEGVRLYSNTIIVRQNIKIGVIGYITSLTSILSQPGKVIFTDEIECIKFNAQILQQVGVDIIIGLGHSGFKKDMEIAKAVPELDVIVGGRSHTFLYSGKQPDIEIPDGPYPTFTSHDSDRIVPIVHAYAFTKYLGFLEVGLSEKKHITYAYGNPILLDSKIEQNEKALKEVEKWLGGINNITNVTLGKSEVILNGSCRFDECNLGNLITDAFIDYAVRRSTSRKWTGAAIAFIQAGGICNSIDNPYGEITLGDVIMVLPYFNPLTMSRIEGKYILKALEWSVARYDMDEIEGQPEFLQFSGLHVVYDLHEPPGYRVVRVAVRCSACAVPTFYPLDVNGYYTILATTFLINGGENFKMFRDHRTDLIEFDGKDTEIVSQYIKRRQIIFSGVEERIQFNSSPSIPSAHLPIFLILCVIYNICH